MDNFEKRYFLDYLDKLIDETDISDFRFDRVFDFFIEEFNVDYKLYKTNRHACLKVEKKAEQNNFLKVFQKNIAEIKKNFIAKETVLEKKLNIIKDIYNLNKEEYLFVVFLILQEYNKIFKNYFDCLYNDKEKMFISEYLNLRLNQGQKLIQDLILKNVLINRHTDNKINPNLINILENPDCNTYEKIKTTILGQPEKSKLSVSDYKHLDFEFKTITKIVSSALKQKQKGINILLYGDVGTGKTEFAKLIANKVKIPMYPVITEKEYNKEAFREDRLIDLNIKQHILGQTGKACILFDEGEDVLNRTFSSKGYYNKLLETVGVPVIWTTNNIQDVDPAFLRRMTYCVQFEKLSEEARLNIWSRVLKKNNLKVNKSKIAELNKNYNISPSLIANAVQITKMINGNENNFEHFIENVAKVVTKKKSVKNAKGFEMANYNENLVNTDLDIKNLTYKIKNCEKLNFSLCLYGEPGTGKSLYAKYLAKELGLKVISKKASELMSCYVGETEKNIAEAFAEAREKGAMLIFDEADSFLQNRNNAVRNWEISQVNEMLTRMESHEFPFICTTNLLNTMDEASLRRFTFKIKFDFLTKTQANAAFEHFFDVKSYDLNIKGLTAGDFATVKKKADFLNVTNAEELRTMLLQEVKLKNSKELKNSIGF